MGVYRRGEVWCISCFHDGRRIRKAIGANRKNAEAVLDTIKVDILGHRKQEMTQRYSRLSPDHRKQAVERLPDHQEAGKTWHKSGTDGRENQ